SQTSLSLFALSYSSISYVHFFFSPFLSSLDLLFFFFFNDTATTEIYTLSLHDALPIWLWLVLRLPSAHFTNAAAFPWARTMVVRSEEHTSELQSLTNLVCRLLLEKKKKK